MKPIRILFLGMSPNKGGIETFIMEIYRFIDKEKVQIDFLTTHPEIAFEEEILSMGGKIHKLNTYRGRRTKQYKEYNKFFKTHPIYNIVHIHKTSLYSTFEMKAMKRNCVETVILHSHASKLSNNKIRSIIMHNYNKIFLHKKVDIFFACSNEAGKYMFNLRSRNKKKFNVIPNAINLEKFSYNAIARNRKRQELKLQSKLVFGHVGVFQDVKNHAFLIDVFNEILKKEKNAFLILVGEGPLKESIEKKVEEMNLQNHVCFLGMVNNVNEIMQALDILILPSKSEGLAITLIEAQAAGLPCYVSNSVPEEVNISSLVKHISLKSEASLWAEIILNDYVNRNERHSESKRLEEAGFNIRNLAKRMVDFYLEKNEMGVNNE